MIERAHYGVDTSRESQKAGGVSSKSFTLYQYLQGTEPPYYYLKILSSSGSLREIV